MPRLERTNTFVTCTGRGWLGGLWSSTRDNGDCMLTEMEDLVRRLEQQLRSFEQLHADEMKRFQAQLETYQRIQNDELKMLRGELDQLHAEIAALKAAEAQRADRGGAEAPVQPTVTRRDLLTGRMPSSGRAG